MSSSFEVFVHCDVIKPILSPSLFLTRDLKRTFLYSTLTGWTF